MSDADIGPSRPPLPDGWGVAPAADLTTRSGGRVLIGGAPFRIIRLGRQGAALTRAWFGGEPVSSNPRHQQLARRLLDAGMAHPRSSSNSGGGRDDLDREPRSVTVVIPVKNDEHGLTRTIEAILTDADDNDETATVDRIIVVDDGSDQPISVEHPLVEVITNSRSVGPGLARQAALSRVSSPAVAFVDAGVTITSQGLAALLDRLTDRDVVAAAPRVISDPAGAGGGHSGGGGGDVIARYETVRSPIDMGPVESPVGPGRMVPYVPTACLVVDTTALRSVGGFDPGLRYGEDVDLVWRLGANGTVRYVPTVTAGHPPRGDLMALMRQRRGYGTAAGPLATRHGDRVAPCSLSPWSALVTGLMVAGRPILAVVTVISTGLALRPKIEPLPDATIEALLLTARGHWYGGLSMLTAAARTWSPALMLGLLAIPTQRKRIGAVLAAAFARRLLDGPREPLAAAADLAIGMADDVSYAGGVWTGSIRERSPRAMLPAFSSWPNRRDTD